MIGPGAQHLRPAIDQLPTARPVPGEPTRLIPAWEPLYDAVGTGMWAYTAAAFRIRLLTPFRLAPRTIYVATHRAETDVPLICGQVFFRGGLWRSRKVRLHFTAREDMFDRGFFAGFPPDLSLRARRLLYPIAAGRYLPRVRVNPLPYPSAHVLRVGKVLEEVPADTRLDAVLPNDVVEQLEARAREAGVAPPRFAREALRGELADLLWTTLPRDRLDSPLLGELWSRRAVEATEYVRNAVELVRSGASTLFFPEGRPSPDGDVGPLRAGLAMLVRRGKPDTVQPVAIAYDSVTCGRAYAYLALGEPFPPSNDDVEATVLAALRRSLPLSAGQLVASELVALASGGSDRVTTSALDAAFARACEDAAAQGRAYDAAWRRPARRRERLADAMRFLVRNGLARLDGPRALVLDTTAVLEDARLRFAAREYASVREAPAA
jgi:1-acyl-sn-glycerol-3-phosphate acyltransferase